jgi:transglutaminase-like putative cysteine protease
MTFKPRDLWLVLPVFMALAPHALYVPVWISLAVAMMLIWRLSPFWRKDDGLQKAARFLLVGAAAVGVFLQYRTLFGPQAGIALLVLMAGFKLLESEGRRDHLIAVLAGYFLLMATLIHHQQILAAAWLLLAAAALTASLLVNQTQSPLPTRAALKFGGTLVLQALPLAILLFFLFPRLPSPMAGLVHTGAGKTGLSDSMAPGSVSQLIQSDEIAFRVDFTDPATEARGLYWRGPVLPRFDGRTWQRGFDDRTPASAQLLGGKLDYTVTLEASEQPWLPVAGVATELPVRGARINVDMEWQTPLAGHDRLRYAVASWQDYRLEQELPPYRRAQALALPQGYNPDALALGRRWAAESTGSEQVVQRALTHFRQQPFHYTLTPPVLGKNSVDDFLFDTRRGFCEHYASAFTVLMRAAGVPARVVTGYQGGELNQVGGHWVVRQRDAHAWAEVWLEDRGWVRVDPTAAVAPERVERGLAAALPASELALLNLPPAWLRQLRQSWDFVDNTWNQWVLGYDFQRQQQLLSRLSPSLASLKGMLWTLLAGVAAILAGLAWSIFRPAPAGPADEIEQHYQRFLDRLSLVGLSRGRSEGPADFARRATRNRPDLGPEINTVTGLYIGLRYGSSDKSALSGLKRAAAAFKPQPHAYGSTGRKP